MTTWKTGQNFKREGESKPGAGEYNNEIRGSKSVSSCFASATDRFGVVKSIKEVKAPGPGSYNSNGLKKGSYNKSS